MHCHSSAGPAYVCALYMQKSLVCDGLGQRKLRIYKAYSAPTKYLFLLLDSSGCKKNEAFLFFLMLCLFFLVDAMLFDALFVFLLYFFENVFFNNQAWPKPNIQIG